MVGLTPLLAGTTSVATTGVSGFTLGGGLLAVVLGYYLFRR